MLAHLNFSLMQMASSLALSRTHPFLSALNCSVMKYYKHSHFASVLRDLLIFKKNVILGYHEKECSCLLFSEEQISCLFYISFF